MKRPASPVFFTGIVSRVKVAHSSSHEVLGCYRGSAGVLLGREQGELLTLEAGDAVLIPAGVGYFNKRSSSDFGVVGAYPRGIDWDMQ